MKVRNSIAFRAPTEPYRFEATVTPKPIKEVVPCSSLTVQMKTGVEKDELQPMYCERCRDEMGKEIVQDLVRVKELDETDMKTLIKKDWSLGVMIAEEEAKKLCQGTDNWVDRMTGRPGLLKTVADKKQKSYKSRRQSLLISLDEEGHEEPEYSDVYVLVADTSDVKASWDAIGTVCRNVEEAQQINVATIGNIDTVAIRKMYESLLRQGGGDADTRWQRGDGNDSDKKYTGKDLRRNGEGSQGGGWDTGKRGHKEPT